MAKRAVRSESSSLEEQAKEMESQVLHCMYNLCRVNNKRREKVK
jgi:hypothetical protein